ncbi:MAG TPA: metallophosphoesterase, partial [Desulfobacteria bacterium]|nr:metallophosphoesterase [Desulfobacteria bacterium]
MRIKHWVLLASFVLLVLLGMFAVYTYHNFKIDAEFTPVPLSFNAADSTSSYAWNGSIVKIQGGFVKGRMGSGKNEELVLRSLSPTPKITIEGHDDQDKSFVLRLENINPVNIQVTNLGQPFKIIDSHTISFTVPVKGTEGKTMEVVPRDDKDYLEFVILGDNRDGYQTFANIIEQVNSLNPIFAVDNGDLVFGGEPNRYRLFYATVAKLQVPLYTTLGNHDIRENGRPIYTQLFGPPYYSFDYRDAHFVFLDSSRGWAEKRAIPEEQYQWLENDLKNAQGKRIFVISHIPPTDPRSGKAPNTLPEIPGVQETTFFDKLMNDYSK